MRKKIQKFLQTTDGAMHPWDGQSQYAKNKIVAIQVSLSNTDKKSARKALKYFTTITMPDGTVFSGEEGKADDPWLKAAWHEKNSERISDVQRLADVLYAGNMTKEQYVEHLLKNYEQLRYVFDSRTYDERWH